MIKVYNDEMINLNKRTIKKNNLIIILSTVVDLLISILLVYFFSINHYVWLEVLTYIINILLIFVLIMNIADNNMLKEKNLFIAKILSSNKVLITGKITNISKPIKVNKEISGYKVELMVEDSLQNYYFDESIELPFSVDDAVKISVFNGIIVECEVIK